MCFVTLTYDSKIVGEDNPQWNVSHVQKFFKRIRKSISFRCSYFVVFERGELRGRCHYHALIFGMDCGATKLITEKWGLGFVKVKPLSPHAVMYVTTYLSKMWSKDLDIRNMPSVPRLVSKRPAIGKEWIDNHSEEVSRKGYVQVDRFKFGVPAYYKKRMNSFDIPVYRLRSKLRVKENQEMYRELLRSVSFYSILSSSEQSVINKLARC